MLRKTSKFSWNEECEQIFGQLKEFLSSPAVIKKPRLDLPIVVYLAVLKEAISAALVQEVDREEHPMYFVSRTLHAAETRYQMIEKVALALVLTARRMRPYFQNHEIRVRTNYPIYKILSKPDLAGRMIGWSVELSEFDIKYEPRGAIKSQCLTDFAAELPRNTETSARWVLYEDGSSNKTACGAGVVLEGPGDVLIEQALQFSFKVTNNQAEYEAILAGLNLANDLGAREVACKNDSQLVKVKSKENSRSRSPSSNDITTPSVTSWPNSTRWRSSTYHGRKTSVPMHSHAWHLRKNKATTDRSSRCD